MYLKRIEMTGFKSFPEKIRLDFNKGITAVVGPNGSGKSNISDAVRWVLGEQSAKALRGSKMEDVIFAGTANRRPLGFAEVSLIIDNEFNELKLPVDYSEITVTRRIYRSGESEYKLNGSPCRLKDIHELFMDTGIGKEGYSIIGQGRIEEFLSSKSDERRHLFEEAAGIVKYKARRFETISKLEKEKQNIIRVNDIIDELEKQLEPMAKQSETAKKYLQMAEELKLVQVNMFIQQAESFQTQIKKINNDLEILKNQTDSEILEKAGLEAGISDIDHHISSLDHEMLQINDSLVEMRSDMEQCENDIILKKEQQQHIHSDMAAIEQGNEQRSIEITQWQQDLFQIEQDYSRFQKDMETNKALLDKKMAQFLAFSDKMSASEKRIEEFNADIIEQMRHTNDIKNSFYQIQSLYSQLEERKEQLLNEENDNAFHAQSKQKEIDESSQLLAKAHESHDRVTSFLRGMDQEKSEIKSHEAALVQKLDFTGKELSEANSKIKLLSDLEKNYEGYYRSVKSILQYKKNNPNALDGVVGPVGSILDVDSRYEIAIETALGQAIQNIITNTEADAKKAIEYLKQMKAGRATFLPISAIKGKDFGRLENEVTALDGVIGIAKKLVAYDPVFENIVSSILGRVIIATDMDAAITVAKKYDYAFKIVTLEGEVINAGGAMTGGSSGQRNAGIFSRGREIKELKSHAVQLEKLQREYAAELENVKKQLYAIRLQEKENRDKLHSLEIERVTLAQAIQQHTNELDRLMSKKSDLQAENTQLMNQLMAANKELHIHEKKLLDAENETEDIKQRLSDFQQSIASYRNEKDVKSQEITDIKVNISALEQKLKALEADQKRTLQNIERNKGLIKQGLDETELKMEQIAMKDQEIDSLEDKIQKLKAMSDVKQSDSQNIQTRKNEYKNDRDQIHVLLSQKAEVILNLKNNVTTIELKKEQIENETGRIFDQMWDDYELTYQQALEYQRLELGLSKLYQEEKRLKNSVKALGPVNVGAIEEYKHLTERHEFLTRQKNDIEDAENKLKDIIMQLTKLMEEQFHQQFKVISENFSGVFAEMFGGGKAYLKLADETNVLESGIDIIAQPPGKNLQSMSLLSGGERALTATALLFAILRMKPSPFCILDEVEAALDDANVVRYAEYLKNFCHDTQFILITHRKGVMESADVLYGITMQEHGVSKLISVKFEDETA